jgi:hypothetical protein
MTFEEVKTNKFYYWSGPERHLFLFYKKFKNYFTAISFHFINKTFEVNSQNKDIFDDEGYIYGSVKEYTGDIDPKNIIKNLFEFELIHE